MNTDWQLKPVQISLRSRIFVWLLRKLLKPWLRRIAAAPILRLVGVQVRVAGRIHSRSAGLPVDYRVIGKVPGPVVGAFDDTSKLALLHLHGGGFLIPASPEAHLGLLAHLCRELDAVGFLPDYRLAPLHKFPAALDDCEAAYRGMLELGFAPQRIVVLGDSAGGNLTLGLLQRIRKAGLTMPACAVPMSPVTELARVHAPPSRGANAKRDALLPLVPMSRMIQLYCGDQDASNPELSPLYADYKGFPPLFFLASEAEILLDDSVLAARAARAAGVDTRLDVWPVLPHAFPVFGALFPEVAQARTDIAGFIRQHVERASASGTVASLRAA